MSVLLKDLWIVDVESSAGVRNEVIQACAMRMDAVIACVKYRDVQWLLEEAFKIAGEKGVMCPSGKPVLEMESGSLKLVAAALRSVLGMHAPHDAVIDIGRLPTEEPITVTGAYIHGFTESRLMHFYGSGLDVPAWEELWAAMTSAAGYTGFFVDGDRAQLDAVPPGRKLPLRLFDVQRLYTSLLGPEAMEGTGMDTALLYTGAVDPVSRVAYRGTHDGLVDCFLTGLLLLRCMAMSSYYPVSGDVGLVPVSILANEAAKRQMVRKWKFGKFAKQDLLAADAGYMRWYEGLKDDDVNKAEQKQDILWSYKQLKIDMQNKQKALGPEGSHHEQPQD